MLGFAALYPTYSGLFSHNSHPNNLNKYLKNMVTAFAGRIALVTLS